MKHRREGEANRQSLKRALAQWPKFPRTYPVRPVSTIRAAEKVEKVLGDREPKPPEPYDLEVLQKRFLRFWNRYRSAGRYDERPETWMAYYEREAARFGYSPSRDIRRLPWVFFLADTDTEGSANWLGANEQIVREFGDWVVHNRVPSAVRASVTVFFRDYPAQLPTLDIVRQFLHEALVDATASRTVSLRRWSQRCREFNLLAADGDVAFANALAALPEPSDEIIARAGFDGGLSRCRFLWAAIQRYLSTAGWLLGQDGFDESELDRLLTVIECDGKLRFDDPAMRSHVAVSLLGPFRDHSPEPAVKARLRSFFMSRLGDPRLPSGRPRWATVPQDVRRVLVRWLVEEALEGFLRLVKETAYDRHWQYREAFWRAYFRADAIHDAWFVLGPQARRIAEQSMAEDESANGSLANAGGDQSVLLMRMSGITIAEWSHNGSCRIWLDGNRAAPKLHEPEYSAYRLRHGSDFTQPHAGSASGTWQYRVADWIYENTGVEIDRDKYMYDGYDRYVGSRRDGRKLGRSRSSRRRFWL